MAFAFRGPIHAKALIFVLHYCIMPKSKKTSRRYYGRSKKVSHRSKKPVIHAIPDLLLAGAVAYPFFDSQNTGFSAAGSMGNVITGGGGVSRAMSVQDSVYNLTANLKTSAIPMAELFVLALAAKYAGKKFGLNNVGSKGVKVL